MLYLWPYKIGSESAKALASGLDVKRVAGLRRLKAHTELINWGNSSNNQHNYEGRVVLNRPANVALATDKLKTFNKLHSSGIPTVQYTCDRSVAESWRTEDNIIYARHLCSGHGGDGIEVVTSEARLPSAPLYTLGFNRSHEYRIHVGGGNVIDATKKRKRSDVMPNSYIKNMSNGWVFCRDNLQVPILVATTAIEAVRSLGLDFGAVDILYKESTKEVRVLEINTAPGLEGTTLTRYINYFRKELL